LIFGARAAFDPVILIGLNQRTLGDPMRWQRRVL
jgi:hypothetical protein